MSEAHKHGEARERRAAQSPARELAADHSWEGYASKGPGRIVHWARVSPRGVAHASCGVVWIGPHRPLGMGGPVRRYCQRCFPVGP